MDSFRLSPLFARILGAALASPLLAASSGAAPPEKPRPAAGSYVAPACNSLGELLVSGLKPAKHVDFVQLRVMFTGAGHAPHLNKQSQTGTPCGTASKPKACHTALEQLTPQKGFRANPCDIGICLRYFLAVSRGDKVVAIDTLEGLRAFLGPIDTPQEAALLAFTQGYQLGCDNPEHGAVRARPDGGFQVIAYRESPWGGGEGTQYVLAVSPQGELREEGSKALHDLPHGIEGRRPEGLRAVDGVSGRSALGCYFATVAHLEAASIPAFLRLHEELVLHGAEPTLQDAALASALEEVMHTQVTTQLAERFGGTPPRPHVEDRALRSLFEVARDNAVEGCARETYGALVAHHQALHARDARVRGAMARIAEDETRHAELSWAIERWAFTRLSEAERAAVREARRAAVETLRTQVRAPVDAALVTEAGVPTPEVAAALFASLEQGLWA